MKNFKIIFCAFSLIVLISCKSEKAPSTHTKLNFQTISAAPVLNGGMFLYGVNADDPGYRVSEFFSTENEIINTKRFQSLPNGNWQFFAMGFKNATDPLLSTGGDIVCGVANNGEPILLTGGRKDVSLDLNVANCINNFFSTSTLQNGGANMNIKILLCNVANFNSADSVGDTCPDPFNGAMEYGFISYPLGDYTSFINSDYTGDDQFDVRSAEGKVTNCSDGTVGNLTENLNKLPTGNPLLFDSFLNPLLFVISSFSSGNCTTTAENRFLLNASYLNGGIGAEALGLLPDSNLKIFQDGSSIDIFVKFEQ